MSEFRSELTRLPIALAKVTGGIAAAVGIGRFGYGVNHSSANTADLLVCLLGFAMFFLASRSEKRSNREIADARLPIEPNPAVGSSSVAGRVMRQRTSTPANWLVWGLLLALIAILAAASELMSR